MPCPHPSLKLLALLAVPPLLAFTPARAKESGAPPYRVSYSSLAERSCSKSAKVLGKYGADDAFICQGHRDLGVAIAVNDAYSWPVLYRAASRQRWDLQQLSFAALPDGVSFPALPANASLEWLDFADGRTGIIFRMQGFRADSSIDSRLLTLQYSQGELHFCGSAISNQQARNRLEQRSNCTQRIAPGPLSPPT